MNALDLATQGDNLTTIGSQSATPTPIVPNTARRQQYCERSNTDLITTRGEDAALCFLHLLPDGLPEAVGLHELRQPSDFR